MNKRIYRRLLCAILLLAIGLPGIAFAAGFSGTAAFSADSAHAGDEVVLTVNINPSGGNLSGVQALVNASNGLKWKRTSDNSGWTSFSDASWLMVADLSLSSPKSAGTALVFTVTYTVDESADSPQSVTISSVSGSDTQGNDVYGSITPSSLFLPITPHNFVSIITPATSAQGGYTTHTCSICGYSYIDAHTEPLGSTTESVPSPTTVSSPVPTVALSTTPVPVPAASPVSKTTVSPAAVLTALPTIEPAAEPAATPEPRLADVDTALEGQQNNPESAVTESTQLIEGAGPISEAVPFDETPDYLQVDASFDAAEGFEVLKAAARNVPDEYTAIQLPELTHPVYAFTDRNGATQFRVYGRMNNRKGMYAAYVLSEVLGETLMLHISVAVEKPVKDNLADYARGEPVPIEESMLPEGYQITEKWGVLTFTNLFGRKEYRVLGEIPGIENAYYPSANGRPRIGSLAIDLEADRELMLGAGEKPYKVPDEYRNGFAERVFILTTDGHKVAVWTDKPVLDKETINAK